jgi:hypothetical protein
MRVTETCSALSVSLEEPLFATAPEAVAWLLVEQSGPWGAKAFRESRLDDEVGRELEGRAKAAGVKALLVKRPGARANGTRCLAASCSPGATFLEELAVGDQRALLDLDLEGLAAGRRLGGVTVEEPAYLVCTNGKRDACCARLGRPVIAALDAEYPGRVYECSHLGGHRFAANLVCLPDGLVYGRLGPVVALDVVRAHERRAVVLDHLRGRSAFEAAAQAAEHYLRQSEGLPGLDDVTLHAVEEEGGEVIVRMGVPGDGSFAVRLRQGGEGAARLVSCADSKVERPRPWLLAGLRPTT